MRFLVLVCAAALLGGCKRRAAPTTEAPPEPKALASVNPAKPTVKPVAATKKLPAKLAEKGPAPRPQVQLGYDLKGDRLGMTLADFKARHRRLSDTGFRGQEIKMPWCSDQRTDAERQSTREVFLSEELWHVQAKIVGARLSTLAEDFRYDEHTPTLAKVPAKLHVYQFIDERLYRVRYTFERSGFLDVLEAMQAAYGKPTSTKTEQYQNSFGAKFSGLVATWDNQVSEITLEERSTDLATSGLTLIHRALDQEAESRRKRFHKPKL